MQPNETTALFFLSVLYDVLQKLPSFPRPAFVLQIIAQNNRKIDSCIAGLPQNNLIYPVVFSSVFLLVLFLFLPQHMYKVNLMPGICGTAESLVVPQENLVDQYQFYVTYRAFFDPSSLVIKKACPCVSHLLTALLGFSPILIQAHRDNVERKT